MDPGEFTAEAFGQRIKAPQGYWAFVPQPLPPDLIWSAELIGVLSAADRALGRLAGVGQMLANPYLLINPFMRREAVLSSRIEGTQASLSDLFFFEAAPSTQPAVADVREVANYVQALEHGLQRQRELPVSLRLLCEMHALLMAGVHGSHLTPGEFRRDQNWIGSLGCTVHDATYVPPPPMHLTDALDAFEKYLHLPSNLPPLVRLAAIHYQFEAIHPFRDGNGRIGRLLITLLLCVEGLLPAPLLYLSAYFERHRQQYYEHLLAVSQAGRWSGWVTFFLRGVAEQAADAVERSNRLFKLRDELHHRCHAARSSALLLKLVDDLFTHPATTVARTAKLLGVTPRAAQNNIDRLLDLGVLREVTGNRRNRLFVAEEILRTIEGPAPGEDAAPADGVGPTDSDG
jgi:Fic family protein